jgi:S-adenosylmethionine:tRNA ribosyltransferase-isomerase
MMARTASAGVGARMIGGDERRAYTGFGRPQLTDAPGAASDGSGVAGARGISALRTDEVSRHAVRLVTVARDSDEVALHPFDALPQLLRTGDLVVVNDAATLPASLFGRTGDGRALELRLSGPIDGNRMFGVLLGAGDYHTPTEHRAAPPAVAVGDRISIGSIHGVVANVTGRRVELVAQLDGDALWQQLYAAGRPVQYSHRSEPLPLWSVQTAYAARPWSAEMPSAGRPLTWSVLLGLRRAGVQLASLTHAAGLSSTGDEGLDRALPWPERYQIPRRTDDAIRETHARHGRVIAIGTTVVRALEASGGVAGSGIATGRLDARSRLTVVDGLVSGLHVPGESHFDLLSAFAPAARLARAIDVAATAGLSGHELGDACLIV